MSGYQMMGFLEEHGVVVRGPIELLALPELFDTFAVPPEVAACRPVLEELCAELAASPVPLSLPHNDLHNANVFADGRVFDWGDSCVSHPFAVLLVSLRLAEQRFKRSVGGGAPA